jgi:signal recognition particle subunit SRP54
MFQDLTDRFEVVLKRLRGHGKLTEKNIADTMREVRRVLLEADVNFKVAKAFVASVQDKALGHEVLTSITPAQQVIKVIKDELTILLGHSDVSLRTGNVPPTIIMLVGLQGCGKTTFAGKLAKYLKEQGSSTLLVAADLQRPAAVEQLRVVGQQVGVEVLTEHNTTPVEVCRQSIRTARQAAKDVVIFDTAGRLHVDATLMAELTEIKQQTKPHEILFVADGMTGQDGPWGRCPVDSVGNRKTDQVHQRRRKARRPGEISSGPDGFTCSGYGRRGLSGRTCPECCGY